MIFRQTVLILLVVLIELDKYWIDAEEGVIYSKSRKRPLADIINSRGYAQVEINGKKWLKHRLIWEKFHNIVITDDVYVDHINGDKLDNRISNLRITDNVRNNQNKSKRKDSTQPFKGVQRKNEKFSACITIQKKRHFLGTFKTAEEAANAYKQAAKTANRQLGAHFKIEE